MRRAKEISGFDYRTGRHEHLPRKVWRKRMADLAAAGCRSRRLTERETGVFDARGTLVVEIYCTPSLFGTSAR
jgi:hypothetical protein